MRSTDIELWVHRVLKLVEDGKRAEDARVELKSEWPSPERAARLVAGHANASQGDPILWIIGADDSAGTICGATDQEFSSWHKTFVSCFDDPSPHLTELVIPYGSTSVVGMVFDTDRPPYVVRHSGSISREIPYRQGSHVNSANRLQLLRILAPITEKRELGLVWSWFMLNVKEASEGELFIRFAIAVMVSQRENANVYLASHQTKLTITFANGIQLNLPPQFHINEAKRGEGKSALAVSGPAIVIVTGDSVIRAREPFPEVPNNPISVQLLLNPPNLEHPLSLDVDIPFQKYADDKKCRYWKATAELSLEKDFYKNNVVVYDKWQVVNCEVSSEPSSFLPGPPPSSA